MAHLHNHECTCMLDGADYVEQPLPDHRYDALKVLNQRVIEENMRLKALLDQNNIVYQPTEPTAKPRRMSLRHTKTLPYLPKEVQLKILGFAVTCAQPIIDPFVKVRPEHLTTDEKRARKKIPVQLFAVSRDFKTEGLQLFIANNNFVFTQVAALQRFAQVPADLRSNLDHVTLRVVGRYYDNQARKQNFFGISYHPDLRDFKTQIYARPSGARMDRGLHAYCYQQFGDFLKALQIPKSTSGRGIEKLFPSLNTIRIDLVNFCDHLWLPNRDFSTIIRWHAGPLVEELIITGVPEDDPEEGVEGLIDRLVKDEGVFASGPPIFASLSKSLKPLRHLGLATRVVRCEKDPKKVSKAPATHPEGGKAPPSMYSPGRTIWKFIQERLDKPEKKWIEFDRRSGYPTEDLDMYSDDSEGLDDMYDFGDNFFDFDAEDSTDEASDSGNEMPGLEEF
ncbi:hypothetical protein PVAG01_01003 [Phlyctema vagabunda]|uniref:Uncharacterized protein n=1 Tax=Phlyctema vagabunda TaxID=108571 RepID=A0ABR4PW37_9HELO